MTDLEKLKARVQETEFPVGAKIKEGDIEVEVIICSHRDYDVCGRCIFSNEDCFSKSFNCIGYKRIDDTSIIYKQTNGN